MCPKYSFHLHLLALEFENYMICCHYYDFSIKNPKFILIDLDIDNKKNLFVFWKFLL